MKTIRLFVSAALMLSLLALAACNQTATPGPNQAEVDSLRALIKTLAAGNQLVSQHLATFDTLDYTVFSNQQWGRLHESHAQDVKVYWPDGHLTTGIGVHIEDLKKLFIHAPNTRIKLHPIKFGSGDYTAVTGIMEGTFTKPMPLGDGKFVQPTGKAFKLPMATIGIWKDGVITEEYLYWDNQTYATQMGISGN